MALTSSEGILEDLLEAEEFKDRQIDSRVESETSLIRTKGGVELNTVSTVELWLSLVILPDDTELDDALRDRDDLEGGFVFWVCFEECAVFEG